MEFSTIAIAAEHSVGCSKLPCRNIKHTQLPIDQTDENSWFY